MNAKRHSNGGGLILGNAKVDRTAFVGANCVVRDNAQVLQDAVIDGMVVVEGNSIIDQNASVTGICCVSGYSHITEYATINSIQRFDSVRLGGFTFIDDYQDNKRVRPPVASASGLTLRKAW